jgi:hypothetical protein
VGFLHCHGSEGVHPEQILQSARVVQKGRYCRCWGYWKEGWHSGRADCHLSRNCCFAWALIHMAEVIVEGQASSDCVPVFASMSACSLPGMLVWEGVHMVRRFQPSYISVLAVVRVSHTYWWLCWL